MIKVLLADDHALITDGVVKLLADEEDIEVVSVCRDGSEAYTRFFEILPDIALLDIDMPEMNGLDCASAIIAERPQARVAILTMHEEMAMIKKCIEMGVKGYFLKTIDQGELITAIRSIHAGRDYFPADVTKALLEQRQVTPSASQDSVINELSKRELEIIKHLAQGMSNKEIADALFISPRTVDTHRTNIMRKLDVNNVVGIVRFAFKNGLAE